MEMAPITPVFVGRRAELAGLVGLAESAAEGECHSVFVGGEAGVGKSRLMDELLATVEPLQAITAVGGCVQVGGEELPFAPLTEALRALARQLPDEIRAASAGQEEILTRLLPDLGTPEGPTARGEDDSSRLFELIVRILEQISAHRLVVLIVEDLHWADASTCQLLSYLIHSRRQGRLLVIGTYRSDDVARRHPLRALLAEVDRVRTARRFEVPRLSRIEVVKQLTGILGVDPDPALRDEIVERSDGNPFFVEELVHAYLTRGTAGLDNLRDLLLIRLEPLSEDSQHIVQIVAEGGTAVTYPLLKAVARWPEDRLLAALRAAVLAEILVPVAGRTGYRFRHSLVREAVVDSLLPGERPLINRQYAEAIEGDPALVRAEEKAARLARHWYEAYDYGQALPMSVAASIDAGRRYAHAERSHFLERAMELWDRVPADIRRTVRSPGSPEGYPARTGPTSYLDLVAVFVVTARNGGDRDRALSLVRKALELVAPQDDPLTAAWFWAQRSMLMQDLSRGDGWAELSTARELVSGRPASVVSAQVLVLIANWGARHRPGPESLQAAEEAVEAARLAGAEDLELQARITRSWLAAETDTDDSSLAELWVARRRAEEIGAVATAGRANTVLPSILEGMGRSEQAVSAAEHGIQVSRSLGLAETESWVRSNQSLSLFSLGRWAEADSALDEAASVARSLKVRGAIAVRRSLSLLVRGDVDAAAEQLAGGRELLGTKDLQPQFLVALADVTMMVAARQGRYDDARAEFLRAHDAGLTAGPLRYALPMLCTAAGVEAEISRAGGRSFPAVLDLIRAALAQMTVVFEISTAFATLLRAELSRAEQADEADRWAQAVAAFAPLQRPYELALAEFGHGRALLDARHQRADAAESLTRAYRTADRLGAVLLMRDIEELAGRAGVVVRPESATGADAKESPAADAKSLGLTAREADVLRLMAKGYRNRRIAEELYISEKTVSTHASRILSKLDVVSRTEAAAMAHRLHLVDG
jgi:DNA-binding CsgD family transcriptional regulator